MSCSPSWESTSWDSTIVLPVYIIHIFLPYSFQIITNWENPLAVSPEGQRGPERLDIAQEGNLKSAGAGCPPWTVRWAWGKEDWHAGARSFYWDSRKKKKKRVYCLWNKGLETQEECKDIASICGGKIRKAKARQEFNLAIIVRNNNKCFFQIYQQQKEGQNLLPLLDAAGNINTEDEEEADVVNVFFTSVFNSQTSYSQDTEPPDLEDSDREQNKPPKFKRKLEGAWYFAWTITYMWCWESWWTWLASCFPPFFSSPGQLEIPRWLTLTHLSMWCPLTRRVRRRIQGITGLLAWPWHWRRSWSRPSWVQSCNICKKNRTRPSQHGFTKGRYCLTNLISFCDQATHLVNEGKAVNVIYIDFSKAFDTVFHMILLESLAAHGLDRCTLHWVKSWLAGGPDSKSGG